MGPLLHALHARLALPPRFAATYCSQCGNDLGPGNAGLSNCAHHAFPYPLRTDSGPRAVFPAGVVPRIKSLAERTKHMETMLVSIGEHAQAEVRWTSDDDGIELHAVELNGSWIDPETVFLRSLLNCMRAEIECALSEEDDHQRTVAAHMGAV